MYKAVIEYTRGYGLEKGTIKADSYKELNEKVESFIEKYNGKETTVWINKTAYKIFKVVYNYPSGKKYTRKIS